MQRSMWVGRTNRQAAEVGLGDFPFYHKEMVLRWKTHLRPRAEQESQMNTTRLHQKAV